MKKRIDLKQPFWTPDLFGQEAIKLLAFDKIGFLEFGMRTKRESALLDEPDEPGIMFVRLLVKALSQKILLQVVFALLFVGEVPVTRVEAFGEKEETTDAISVFREIRGVGKLIGVPVVLIGPDVLDFVSLRPLSLNVFVKTGRTPRLRLDIIRHPRQQIMNLSAVHSMQPKRRIAGKRFFICIQPLQQPIDEGGKILTPDLTHDLKHAVLHGRIIDGTPVPDAAGQQDVQISRNSVQLGPDLLFGIVPPKRSKQDRVLEREIELSIVIDRFEPWDFVFFGFTANICVSAGIEGKIFLDQSRKGRAVGEAHPFLLVAYPTVKL
ncbi:hypothetical protein ABG088_05965 [Hydrogenibacillus schlegelii]